jgi:hypothetical protein
MAVKPPVGSQLIKAKPSENNKGKRPKMANKITNGAIKT